MARGLLIAGTTSDAGKSLLTAGVCRWLRREGFRVAPFKSQNMSNNSMVCPDGAEIGRAQWVQAVAAGVSPEAAMNPVLLKPGTNRRSHIVLMGKPHGTLSSREWATGRKELARSAFAAFDDLAARHDVVIAEGAGSIAEVNLREGDYVNLGLARAVDLPVVVVGDIDRGGVLAAMYGCWALLEPADRAHLAGWIVNKFRGEVDLLRPGLDVVRARTGLPVHGVLPWLEDAWLDGEDALALAGWQHSRPAAREQAAGQGSLRVAVVRFPRLSNATDIDALAAEPGVEVLLADRPHALMGADLIVLPGSRSTLSDLAWLRRQGLEPALRAHAERGGPILGICGGYQMLARRIEDRAAIEAPTAETQNGLSLLPVEVSFGAHKHLGTPRGSWRGHAVEAYEIHHGIARRSDDDRSAVPFLDGWQQGNVAGTTWHGAFENDAFRRAYLSEAALRSGSTWRPRDAEPGFRARREAMIERLADAVAQHLDTDALLQLIDSRA